MEYELNVKQIQMKFLIVQSIFGSVILSQGH